MWPWRMRGYSSKGGGREEGRERGRRGEGGKEEGGWREGGGEGGGGREGKVRPAVAPQDLVVP